MASPEFSVIVPAYQAETLIGACVAALGEQTLSRARYEVLVVDDGSTDGTGRAAHNAGADRVVRIPHQGPSAARNAGIAAAHGGLVLFTDADCVPAPDWLAQMTAPFNDPEIVGGKGTYRTRQHGLIARLTQLEFEIRYERMLDLPRIDFIDTYAAAYRRALLLEHGGFDTAFPIPSAEDVELAFRLARQGYRLVFIPAAYVWHRHPARLWTYLRRKGIYGFWRAPLYLRYPDKAGGDAHTDPMLKWQFLLGALLGLSLLLSLFWTPGLWAALGLLLIFLLTTWPFVRWAWTRDRPVALIWPGVTLLRVFVQGIGLGAGLLWHGLFNRHREDEPEYEKASRHR